MSQTYSIGIIGFGIAGAAAAVFLARQGHRVIVLEQAPAVGPVGTGLLLQLSGQVALQRLGLLDQVTRVSEPLSGLHAVQQNGATLIRLSYEEVAAGYCGYGVHRGVLFEALRLASVSAGVTVCLGCEVTDWRQTGDSVYAVDTSGVEAGPFDFIICTDGARSRLRMRIAPDLATVEYGYGAIWTLGANTQVRGELFQVVSGTRYLLGLLPTGGGQCTLFWGLPVSSMPQVRENGIGAFRDQVLKFCPLAEETLSGVECLDDMAFTTYRRGSTQSLFNTHIMCLGDAAHPMSPHLGQGANLALMDAFSFADALSRSESFVQAAAACCGSRQSTVRYYARLSRVLTPFFQSDISLFGRCRDVALPLLGCIPPMRREMARAMAGIKQGLFEPNLDFRELNRVYST